MPELDVTHMVADASEMFELSGSRVEHGQNAGQITWANSLAYAAEHPLLSTEEMRDDARSYFAEFGAWDEDEIAGWSDAELDAIMAQDVAHAIREMDVAKDYEDYQRLVEQGTLSGNLYRGDDGRWYFYVGM